MRFTKKQVNEIVTKRTKTTYSKAVALAILFGILFGITITFCYHLNKEMVNSYWERQYNHFTLE